MGSVNAKFIEILKQDQGIVHEIIPTINDFEKCICCELIVPKCEKYFIRDYGGIYFCTHQVDFAFRNEISG